MPKYIEIDIREYYKFNDLCNVPYSFTKTDLRKALREVFQLNVKHKKGKSYFKVCLKEEDIVVFRLRFMQR